MVRGFNVSKDETHIGLVLFSSNAEVLFDFEKHYDKASILQEIDDMNYPGQSTRTGLGLSMARIELFEKGSRSGVPNVLMVITDGKSADSVEEPAQKLRDSGVTIYSIGIGKNFEASELNAMATDPDSDHVFTADFDVMQTIVDKIRYSLCKSKEVHLFPARVSTDCDCCAFAPNIFGKLPKNTISRNYKITNKRLL